MKQFLRYILTLVVILLTTTPAWAECVLINSSTQIKIPWKNASENDNGRVSSETYAFNGPCGILTFDYRLDADFNASNWHKITVQGLNTSNQWIDIANTGEIFNSGTKQAEFDISSYANTITAIRFKRNARSGGFLGAYNGKKDVLISNIKLIAHTSISASPATLSFPLTAVGATSAAQTVTITYSNIGNNYSITSTNTDDFSISPLPFTYDKCGGTMQFSITFHPQGTTGGARFGSFTIAGDGNGKSNNNTSITINVSGTAKGFPEFTWKGNTQYYVDESLDLSNLWTSSSNETTRKYSIKRFTSTDTFGSADPHFTDATNTKILLSKEGELVLQMHQDASTTYSPLTKEVTIKIVKHTTNFALNFANEYYVDDEINKSTFFTNSTNSEVAIQVSDKTADNRALFTYNGSILKANGATLNANSETTTITVTQPETYKWTGKTLTQQVWVKKHEVRAHINPSTAVWNDIVDNPFSASSTHKVVGTVTPINGFSVAQEDNAHIGQLDPNTYNIQTYHTSGTAHFRVTRPADRKYQALNQVVGLTVGQSSETCPLTIYNYSSANGQTTYDSNKEYAVGYHDDPSGFLFDLSDAGDILSLDVRKQGLAVDDSYLYVIGYDEKGQNETTLMTLSNRDDITTNYTTHTCTISDITETRITRILVKSSSSNIWNDALAKFFKNIRVTRKQYLEPQITGKDFYLTQASIRMNFEGTFILDWSTCADEILLTCDNPSFVITPSVIDASEQKSGSTPITITCRDENATNLVGKVTIYDQMQQTDFYVHCKYLLQQIVWDQYFNNLETDEAGYIAFNQALNAYAATVDGTPTGAPITYTLDENAKKIAHLETTNGVTTLHITGQGDGKITASVQAFEKDGRTYSADEVTRDIRVRKYGDLCNTTYHLSDGFNLYTIQNSESFNIQGMNASTLLFKAYKDWYGVNYFYVQFSTDNEVSWSDKHIELDSENKDYTVLIPDGTTHLRFVTKTGATFYKYISNIYVKQKMELTPDTKQINETIYVNTPYERTIRVTYSDIPAIQTHLTQNTTNRLLLTPNQPVINNCGDFGTYDYTLSGEWSQPQTITETLRFFTSAGLPQTVNINIHVILGEQNLVSVKDGPWSDPNTWNKSIVPQAYHNVQVEHQLSIDTHVEVHSLIMTQGASLHITSQGGLNIHAGGYSTSNNTADITLDNLKTGAEIGRASCRERV